MATKNLDSPDANEELNTDNTEQNLAIIESLRQQTEDRLYWDLDVVNEFEYEGGEHRYGITTIDTKSAGPIKVTVGGQYLLGPDEVPGDFNHQLQLIFTAQDGQQRRISASPTYNPQLFPKLKQLFQTVMHSIEVEQAMEEEARLKMLKEKETAFELGLNEIGGIDI